MIILLRTALHCMEVGVVSAKTEINTYESNMVLFSSSLLSLIFM